MLEPELNSALQAVRQAASICRIVQQSIDSVSLEKKDKSPVTVADFASQAVVCRQLQDTFPEDPIIGEEGAAELRDGSQAAFLSRVVEAVTGSGIDATGEDICAWIDRGGLQEYRPRFWTLDPIDGTKGFLRKQQYAISLALIVDGQIVLGVLGCPNLLHGTEGDVGVLAWAIQGQGAWVQPLDRPESDPEQLSVTKTADTGAARFCESVESGHSAHGWSGLIAQSLGIQEEPYRIDSQCKYLAVARGDADIYLRLPTRKGYQEKIWDHAGGVQVIREAGGRVTDIHGEDLDFSQGATLAMNQGVIVTNGRLHDEVVAAVQEHTPEDVAK